MGLIPSGRMEGGQTPGGRVTSIKGTQRTRSQNSFIVFFTIVIGNSEYMRMTFGPRLYYGIENFLVPLMLT